MDDLSANVVHNVHLEGPARSTAHPGAAVIVLLGKEHILAQRVKYPVLVGRLPASECFKQLDL